MSVAPGFWSRFARRRPVIAKVGHHAAVRVKKAYKVCTKWKSLSFVRPHRDQRVESGFPAR